MDFEKVRLQIRNIIFGFTGILVFLIFLGVLFQILGDVNIFTSIADFLMAPFKGIFVIEGYPALQRFHLDAVLIVGVYLFAAYVISEFITGFFYESGAEVLTNVIDGLLKIMELFLLMRIVLDLFGTAERTDVPTFVSFVYSMTDWASGFIVNSFFGSVFVNISAIVTLIVLLLIDIFCERFLLSFFQSIGRAYDSVPKKDLPEFRMREKITSIFKRDSED